jgi:hypothetical protein
MRTPAQEINVLRRTTKGVRIVKLADGIRVIDAAAAAKEEEEPETEASETVNPETPATETNE